MKRFLVSFVALSSLVLFAAPESQAVKARTVHGCATADGRLHATASVYPSDYGRENIYVSATPSAVAQSDGYPWMAYEYVFRIFWMNDPSVTSTANPAWFYNRVRRPDRLGVQWSRPQYPGTYWRCYINLGIG